MAIKIFTWVPTHQGSVLALIYLWYTNTEVTRKNKLSSFTHTEISCIWKCIVMKKYKVFKEWFDL